MKITGITKLCQISSGSQNCPWLRSTKIKIWSWLKPILGSTFQTHFKSDGGCHFWPTSTIRIKSAVYFNPFIEECEHSVSWQMTLIIRLCHNVHRSTRTELQLRCQDNRCLFKQKQNQRLVECQLSQNLEPKASAMATSEHLALPYESWILKKIETSNELLPNKLQFYFTGGESRGWVTGRNPRKIQHDCPFANSVRRSPRQASEFNKTKAWLSIITAYQ